MGKDNKVAVKSFFKRYWVVMVGIAVGALGGWLYWYFVGCESGSCAITASPVNSTLWGAVLGWLIFSAFASKKKKGDED